MQAGREAFVISLRRFLPLPTAATVSAPAARGRDCIMGGMMGIAPVIEERLFQSAGFDGGADPRVSRAGGGALKAW